MKRCREQVIWDFVQDWLRKAEGDCCSTVICLRSLSYTLQLPFLLQVSGERII
jgi:hypothetical protein